MDYYMKSLINSSKPDKNHDILDEYYYMKHALQTSIREHRKTDHQLDNPTTLDIISPNCDTCVGLWQTKQELDEVRAYIISQMEIADSLGRIVNHYLKDKEESHV